MFDTTFYEALQSTQLQKTALGNAFDFLEVELFRIFENEEDLNDD